MKQKFYYIIVVLPTFLGIFLFLYQHNILLVYTDSMAPTISQGAIIAVRKDSAPALGDVITYENQAGNYVTHRVVGIESLDKDHFYYTKGDANSTKDPFPVGLSSIMGRVVFSFPYLGHAFNLLTSPIVLLFVFYIPCGHTFGKLLNSFVNSRRN